MLREDVSQVVESAKFGTRRVRLTLSEKAGREVFQKIESACTDDYIRFVREGEQSEFIRVYLGHDYGKAHSFTVGLTDTFYEHGLDWIAALAPYLASCEPA